MRLESDSNCCFSNEVNHERNITFHCNPKVIKMVCNQIDRTINTVYIFGVMVLQVSSVHDTFLAQ